MVQNTIEEYLDIFPVKGRQQTHFGTPSFTFPLAKRTLHEWYTKTVEFSCSRLQAKLALKTNLDSIGNQATKNSQIRNYLTDCNVHVNFFTKTLIKQSQ